MNYISLINSFWDSAITNPLSTGQVLLYLALLHVCNRNNWTEWFQVPNQVLSVLTGLSRSGILKARNELKQKGMIEFRERGTKATVYKIIAESKQVSAQDGVQNGTQISKQDGSTLYKQNINETKHIKTPPISPLARIEEFLSAYPKTCDRFLVEREYATLILTGKMSEDDLVSCAQNYAETCRIEERPQ